MKYNVSILRLQITTYQDEFNFFFLKKKTNFYVLVGSVGFNKILYDPTYDSTFYDPCAILKILVR